MIGSSIVTEFKMQAGKPVLVRQSKIFFVDGKEGKAIGLQKFAGRRPIAAFGNADGDFAMLQWTRAGNRPHLGMLVHHTSRPENSSATVREPRGDARQEKRHRRAGRLAPD